MRQTPLHRAWLAVVQTIKFFLLPRPCPAGRICRAGMNCPANNACVAPVVRLEKECATRKEALQ